MSRALTPANPNSLLADYLACAESLWQQCHEQVPGLSVEVQERLASSNTDLIERARRADMPPTVLIALEQTAGRGRRGKAWHSSPTQSLTFSVAWPLRPSGSADGVHLSGLSLAVGATLAQALGPRVRVKWPNDLCAFDAQRRLHKLGGILIETTQVQHSCVAVIGVGLNLQTPSPTDWLEHDARALPPMGLSSLGLTASGPQTLQRIMPPLFNALLRFSAAGFAAFAPAYAERDVLAGQTIAVFQAGESPVSTGRAAGVDDNGALIVHTEHGQQAIIAGEVSVRLSVPATPTPKPAAPTT